MEAPTLRERLSRVPEAPGVYLWKGDAGEVLYVGKAKSLRSRMRSYLTGQPDRPQIEQMMTKVTDFDYVVTDTEVESLILEANLIKQLHPRYNVDYRDDKTYPFIAVTTGDPFPAVKYTRERHRPGTRYFGPYTDAKAARETIDVVRRIYPICHASCVEWKRLDGRGGEPQGKACFDFHVGKGPGACVGVVSEEEYGEQVQAVLRFLSGRHSGVAEELESRMQEAASELDFERAARFRNSLEAVRKVLERQKVVSGRPLDADVFGVWREETIAGAHVFVVREGRVLIGNEFVLDKGLDVPEVELVEGLLLRYYGETPEVPREVVVSAAPEDPGVLEGWLSERRGTVVRLTVPRRGEKRRLLQMAEDNARHTLARYRHKTRYDEQRANEALLQLESALALPAPPMRIECFDVSTLHGAHSVASMVVFEGGRPDTSAYRRFRIGRIGREADDVGMMKEVVRRRVTRGLEGDQRFGRLPDLLLVDGGKPQLSAAMAALAELGVRLPVAALAKREEELFVPGFDGPVRLPAGSASLYLLKRVRDEAHRFAVTYHRELRGKAMTSSILDEVPGVGGKRKKALMKAFGSVKRLREAEPEEVAKKAGIPRQVADEVSAVVRRWAATSPEDPDAATEEGKA